MDGMESMGRDANVKPVEGGVVRKMMSGLDHQAETLGNIVTELDAKVQTIIERRPEPEAKEEPELSLASTSTGVPLADDLAVILSDLRGQIARLEHIVARITPL